MDCPKCGEPRDVAGEGRRVDHAIFRGRLTTWDALFREAAEFATRQGAEKIISISHSGDGGDGVVTVWYWR